MIQGSSPYSFLSGLAEGVEEDDTLQTTRSFHQVE